MPFSVGFDGLIFVLTPVLVPILAAKTCSTAERTADRFALARAMRSGIGRRCGFR